jgi:hypothetical protein
LLCRHIGVGMTHSHITESCSVLLFLFSVQCEATLPEGSSNYCRGSVFVFFFSAFVFWESFNVSYCYTALPWESQKLKIVNCSLCYFILPHFEGIFFSLHNQMFYSNKTTCLWRLQRKLELFKKLRPNWRNNVRSSHGACNLKSACGYI